MLRKNVTKDVFLSIWILKNLPIIVRGPMDYKKNKERVLAEEKYQQ